MRTYEFAPLDVRRAQATEEMVRIAQAGRRVRRKPRSPEQREVIVTMAAAGMQRRVASRRLIRTGPRSWKVIPLRAAPSRAPLALQPSHPDRGADQ